VEAQEERQVVRSNRSIPACTVIPELAYPEIGEAIDWLCDRFGFTLRIRIGNHRAQLNVGDGAVVLIEQPVPEIGGQAPSPTKPADAVMVRVPDVDSHHQRAQQKGVGILRPPADYPYGERQYTVEDFMGRRWTFTQSIADVTPEDWGGTSGQL
jgi:uncharacterized glyoxalase superfamily protein PhnB